MLTFLGLLAVLLGWQAPQPPPAPKVTAGSLTPAVPELRPLPAPASPVPLPGQPPPPPFRITLTPQERLAHPLNWNDAPRDTGLSWWGRRQSDGG